MRDTMAPKAKAKGMAMKSVMKTAMKSDGVQGRSLPKSAGKVAPSSGLADKGSVLKPYDVDLNVVDAGKNMSKFYRMQIVESKDKSKYWFVQHWGRIGTAGQTQVKGPSGKDQAIKLMEQKFKSKTKKSWADRGSAGPGSGDSSARAGHGSYEMTARLKKAGAGMATKPGQIAISLMWDHTSKTVRNDLDLWVTAPSGEKIGYNHKKSKCGGELDVDRRQDAPKPVENIVWTKKAPKGTYTVKVQNFSLSHNRSIPFQVGIVLDGGERQMIDKVMPAKAKQWVTIKKFKY